MSEINEIKNGLEKRNQQARCKHPIEYRQAVGCGLDQYSHGSAGIICVMCGKIIVNGLRIDDKCDSTESNKIEHDDTGRDE